jgi:hypothetical protein
MKEDTKNFVCPKIDNPDINYCVVLEKIDEVKLNFNHIEERMRELDLAMSKVEAIGKKLIKILDNES